MTPTGDLVQTVDRPAFSSVDNEGSSAAPSFVIDPSTGTAYVVVGDVFSNIKIFGFDGFPKQSQVEAIVAGDVNGDGLDDLLVTDRGFVTYRADSGLDNVGRSYIITGRDLAGGISLLQDSHQIIQARNMGERGAALGDLDGDGYDDFAVTRSVENGQDQIGSAFVYYGSGDQDDVIVDAAQSADIVYVRPDVQSLSSGQAWGGISPTVTGGDFNGDGLGDIAIGLPSTVRIDSGGTVITADNRGRLLVDLDAQRSNEPIVLGDGGVELNLPGMGAGDQLGSLTVSGPIDFDGDGTDDLWVGSAGVDGSRGGVSELVGIPRTQVTEFEATLLTNSASGSFLIDRGDGQPYRFSDSLSGPEVSRWYEFTLGGDGRPGDQIRILEDRDYETLFNPPVVADFYAEDGRVLIRDSRIFDLRSVKAGTYRIHIRLAEGHTDAAYSILVAAPALGASHATVQRAQVFGGSGDDVIVTAGQDSVFGQEGSDQIRATRNENRDRDPADSWQLQLDATSMLPDLDPLVSNLDQRILNRVAEAAGLPVTLRYDGTFHVPGGLRQSDLTRIDRLDLSGLGLTDTNGLELLPNLQFVDLSDNDLTRYPTNLPNALVLILDNNQIRDLSPLAGIQIVDNGDAAYVETVGNWQNEVRTAEEAWASDYRFSKDGGTASYTFALPVGDAHEFFMTWPTIPGETTGPVTVNVYDGSIDADSLLSTQTLDQSFPPDDSNPQSEFAGVIWQSLGQVTSASGTLLITISGRDGFATAADAIRAESVTPKTLSLEWLSLLDNPIGDVSRDAIASRLTEINPGLTIDLSPNEHAPLLQPIGPQTVRHGSLDLNDSIAVLPSEVLDGVSDFMVEFWYRTDRAEHATILSAARDNDVANEFFVVLLDPNTVRIADKDVGIGDFTGLPNLADNQWHHYAIVRDSQNGTMRLFIDGQYISQDKPLSSTAALQIADGGLVIGQEQDDVGGGYSSTQAAYGQLDELRFWNRFWDASSAEVERLLQLKQITANKDRAVSATSPSLRAQYKFDATNDQLIYDSTSNAFNGRLGDFEVNLLSEERDTRPAAGRADSAPIREIIRVDVDSLGGSVAGRLIDADGEVISLGGISSDPRFVVLPGSDFIEIEYDALVDASTRIQVIATDAGGRQDRTGFDLNVSETANETPREHATLLTFVTGFGSGQPINPDYGDRVTSTVDGSFRYGGGSAGPLTPNITVDYGDPNNARLWDDDYGNLTDVIYREGFGDDPLEVTLTADDGYFTALHGFDLAGWNQSDRLIDSIEVVNESGEVLFAQSNITIRGAGSQHSSFDFAVALTGQSLTIRLDPGVSNDNVGIDNILFSQFEQSANRFAYGKVFVDSDGDGRRDEHEEVLPGVIVHLLNSSGDVIACTFTDTEGNYRLAGALANQGDSIEVILPSGWETTSPERPPLAGLSKEIPVKRSEDFELIYDFDADPSDPNQVDLDGNGAADMEISSSIDVSDGTASLTSAGIIRGFFGSDDIWGSINASADTGYTIEARIKIIVDPEFPEGPAGSLRIFAAGGGADGQANWGQLNISATEVSWGSQGGGLLSLGTFDNTTEFHDYRLVQIPGRVDAFLVWRDGVLLNPDSLPLAPNTGTSETAQFFISNVFGGIAGRSEIDSLRFASATANAFAPPADFGITRALDIGGDQSVFEGTTVSLTPSGFAFEPATENPNAPAVGDIRNRWDITLPSGDPLDPIFADGLDFTPENEGDYRIVFTKAVAELVGTEIQFVDRYSDHMLLRVTNAAPGVSISSSGSSFSGLAESESSGNDEADLIVPEGSAIELVGDVFDPGSLDPIASYQWIARDDSGVIIDQVSGSGAVEPWSFSIADDGRYEVTLTVDDGVDSASTEPFVIDVTNVLPETTAQVTPVTADGSIELSGSFTDPGDDLWLGEVDFGDGTRRPLVIDEKSFATEHQYEQPGQYEVTVTIDDQDGGVRTETFQIDYQPRVQVAEVTVNEGQEGRSSLTSIGVQFDQVVDASVEAFQIRNRETGQLLTDFQFDVLQGGESTSVELMFSSPVDGNYELVISASGVIPTATAARQMATDFVFGDDPHEAFFRLFGDSDGDRDVDEDDLGRFAEAFLSTEGMSNFDAAFDHDGDGDVDGRDLGQIRRRLGKSLNF